MSVSAFGFILLLQPFFCIVQFAVCRDFFVVLVYFVTENNEER